MVAQINTPDYYSWAWCFRWLAAHDAITAKRSNEWTSQLLIDQQRRLSRYWFNFRPTAMSQAFRLRRLLAVFGFVGRREDCFVLRMADEALRIGAVVFLAPIAFLLELSREFRVALATFPFRYAVLVAPPTGVVILGRRLPPLRMLISILVVGMVGVHGLRSGLL